jgi:hypothetical protein
MQHQYAPVGSALEHKLQLYTAAVYLFNTGKSHPQIVRLLTEHEQDEAYLTSLVDKAMREEWDKLFEYSRQLFANGKTYDEVIRLMSEKEKDEELVIFLCNKWYEWKIELLEHINEAPKNIRNGLLWVIGCGIGLTLVFIYDRSWFSKIVWSLGFTVSLIQFVTGLIQRRTSKYIQAILQTKTTD